MFGAIPPRLVTTPELGIRDTNEPDRALGLPFRGHLLRGGAFADQQQAQQELNGRRPTRGFLAPFLRLGARGRAFTAKVADVVGPYIDPPVQGKVSDYCAVSIVRAPSRSAWPGNRRGMGATHMGAC